MGINAWIRYPNGASRFLQPLRGQQNRIFLTHDRCKVLTKTLIVPPLEGQLERFKLAEYRS